MNSYDKAYEAYLRHFGEEHSGDMLHQFQQTYMGSWPNLQAFAYECLGVFEYARGPLSVLERQEELLGVYFDDSILTIPSSEGEVFVFDNAFTLAQSSVA